MKVRRDIRNACADAAGFTVIEVMVAMVIGSIMLLMLYSAYSSTISHVSFATEYAEYYETLNLAIEKINTDISNCYFNRENKKLAFIGTMEGDRSKLNFVTVDHHEFTMIGSVNKPTPLTDIHEVGYYLAESRYNGEYNLMKREEVNYDDKPEEGGTENLILEGVTELKFEFKLRNDWTTSWDSRESNRVPDAVRVTLKVRHASTGRKKEAPVDEENVDEFVFLSRVNMVR